MKKLFTVFVIPCLIFATFIFMIFDADKTEDLTRFRSSASVEAGKEVKSMVFEDRSDVVYAILIMPKSFLPMLEKFSHHKIARNIKILPAKIEWSQEKMVVMPKTTILKGETINTEQIQMASGEFTAVSVGSPLEMKKKFGAVSLLAILVGQAKRKL